MRRNEFAKCVLSESWWTCVFKLVYNVRMNITITTFTSAVGMASLRILFIQLKGFTEIVCDLALSVENKALQIFLSNSNLNGTLMLFLGNVR